MELFWTPEAIQDREDIYDYIEAANPAAALALDGLFSEKAALLVDHPHLGPGARDWHARAGRSSQLRAGR